MKINRVFHTILLKKEDFYHWISQKNYFNVVFDYKHIGFPSVIVA